MAWAFFLAALDGIVKLVQITVIRYCLINLKFHPGCDCAGVPQTCLHQKIFYSNFNHNYNVCISLPCSWSKPFPDLIRFHSQQWLGDLHTFVVVALTKFFFPVLVQLLPFMHTLNQVHLFFNF